MLMKLNICLFYKKRRIARKIKIWDKVRNKIKKEFDSEHIYNKKH